jgi:hypothetical protein
VKFLSEGELDSRARLAGPAAEQAQSEEMVNKFLRFIVDSFRLLTLAGA